MLHQARLFTKFPLPASIITGLRRVFIPSLLALLILLNASPASAVVKMTDKSVRMALIYGMKNQGSRQMLLGPNWIEGANGSLLLIYSPFMMLASRVAQAGFPVNPTEEDVEKARKKFEKYCIHYADPKRKNEVKFAVNFFGSDIYFAKHYTARIVGFGRGKSFVLKPSRSILDEKADPYDQGEGQNVFVATNAYYFLMKDVENLQEFRLILESTQGGEPLIFRINGDRLY